MNIDRKVIEQALDALEKPSNLVIRSLSVNEAIRSLRNALAQPQPVKEPVAEVVMATKPQNASPAWLPFKTVYAPISWLDRAPIGTKLYTSPQAAQPLTREQRNWIIATCPTTAKVIDAVERAHGITEGTR